MSFLLQKASNEIAVIDGDSREEFSYKRLRDDVENLSESFKSDSKKLFVLLCNNSYETISLYLAVISSGNALMLLDNKLDSELRNSIIKAYSPNYILSHTTPEKLPEEYNITVKNVNGKDFSVCPSRVNSETEINSELALLLTTSGSTGSSKFVRLSKKNIVSNAESISSYLKINQTDRAITSLPIHYSYGLSVINSHLCSGASIVVTNKSVIEKPFWEAFKSFGCTTFSGVPYTYQMMQRLKFHTMELHSLRYFTQAGGHLNSTLKKYFIDAANEKKKEFIVMYGQTEATARISYLPFEKSLEKIDSIGIPIPGGRLQIFDGDSEVSSPEVNGEIIYTGENVMLGYAESRDDLKEGDILNGILRTGDVGYFDSDKYFFVTGRIKRFVKIFGNRVNLDDIEKLLENNLKIPSAVSGKDDMLFILLESSEAASVLSPDITKMITEKFKIHHSVLKIDTIEKLPVSLNGKKDYAGVKSIFENDK